MVRANLKKYFYDDANSSGFAKLQPPQHYKNKEYRMVRPNPYRCRTDLLPVLRDGLWLQGSPETPSDVLHEIRLHDAAQDYLTLGSGVGEQRTGIYPQRQPDDLYRSHHTTAPDEGGDQGDMGEDCPCDGDGRVRP